MKLDYGTLLSPLPIRLSIGNVKKPTLRDIADISFDLFHTYEVFLKCTPETYYTKVLKENGGLEQWQNMPNERRESLTMYELILTTPMLQNTYLEIFKFFFNENVLFERGFFVLYNGEIHDVSKLQTEMVSGIISENNFAEVLDILQQICCIHSKADTSSEDMKFKNDLARKLYEKMQKALKKQEEEQAAKADKNLSLPSIISSVSARHPSINLLNVWDLTVFQLIDNFNKMRNNAVYDIDSTRVSVWGDEKNKFDATLWFKNIFDS